MGPFLPLVVGTVVGGGAVWLAMAIPGLHRRHQDRREAKRDVAAVMAAHRVTDGAPDAGLRRLLAAVRDGRAEW